jgi:hypothetical protein
VRQQPFLVAVVVVAASGVNAGAVVGVVLFLQLKRGWSVTHWIDVIVFFVEEAAAVAGNVVVGGVIVVVIGVRTRGTVMMMMMMMMMMCWVPHSQFGGGRGGSVLRCLHPCSVALLPEHVFRLLGARKQERSEGRGAQL